MWYTGLILLDIYIFWNIASFVTSWAKLNVWLTWLRMELEYAWVPSELAELTEHTIILFIVTVGYYLLPNLPICDWFRHARIWDWLRLHHTHVEFYGELPHLDETSSMPVMYACAPHGMYGENVTMAMVLNPLFSRVRVICTSLLFWIPIARECAAMTGCAPANMHVIMSYLDSGTSIAILPEGLRGIFHDSLDVLKGIPGECGPRHGFIRAALTAKQGCRLVPVYIEGTQNHYYVWNPWPWFQKRMLSRFLYPWPVIHFGHMGTFWPKATTLKIRIGEALIPKVGETVEQLHERFCDALEGLK